MARSSSFRFDCCLTGIFYLGLAITGMFGFLIIRPELFVAGDPSGTLQNIVEHEQLARIGVALELGIVTFQALAAVWFAKLFRDVDAFAAGVLALFGMVNAIAILASAALLRGALDIAVGSTGVDPKTSHLLILLSARFWDVCNVFFGLWLIPMGWLVNKSAIGPRVLGWVLMVGGIGYVLLPYVAVLVPDIGASVGLLSVVATVGEFWMIGLLLWRALRGPAAAQVEQRS
jgi:hypothetical protein